jgi:putative tricarboxylic transport membrane protein
MIGSTRKAVLGAVAAALFAPAAAAVADSFPERPLTIVVPASTGGTNDRAARLMSSFLSEELGQPVQVVNRPGGGNMLGHMYFLQQPADGYTILRTTMAPFLTINQLVQGAELEIEQFHPVNITEIGTSLVATSNTSRFESMADVISALRAGDRTITVGVQPTATDYVNLSIFMEALGYTTDDVRIVTYDSGGPVRNGIIGEQFDIGVVGDQGMAALREEFRPLMTFSLERSPVWEVPSVVEVVTAAGVDEYPNILSGSIQGYLVHSELVEEFPDRYAAIVAAFERISNNPTAIEAHALQDLGLAWMGPEESGRLLEQQHAVISQPDVLGRLSQE